MGKVRGEEEKEGEMREVRVSRGGELWEEK